MTTQGLVVWGIHAGATGDADVLFMQGKCVAIGWDELGDLSSLGKNRDALKKKLAEVYPDMKPGAIPVAAGQLFRFVNEMKAGDIIAYPSKANRRIYLGRLVGDYQYQTEGYPGYPNRRAVEWIREVPRTDFSQGTLYEIGSAMSLFKVTNHADEFMRAIEGSAVPVAVMDDPTVAHVAEDIEDTTRDFVLKTLAQGLKGHPFASFIAHLLGTMGYRTRVAPEGPDGGIDILAHRDELGFEPPIVKVQVKSGEGSIGDPVVSALYGKVSAGEYGLMVTLGTYTTQAKNFARGKANLRLIDGSELVDLILEHYEQFDSWYKGLLPLKRVYVPERVEGG